MADDLLSLIEQVTDVSVALRSTLTERFGSPRRVWEHGLVDRAGAVTAEAVRVLLSLPEWGPEHLRCAERIVQDGTVDETDPALLVVWKSDEARVRACRTFVVPEPDGWFAVRSRGSEPEISDLRRVGAVPDKTRRVWRVPPWESGQLLDAAVWHDWNVPAGVAVQLVFTEPVDVPCDVTVDRGAIVVMSPDPSVGVVFKQIPGARWDVSRNQWRIPMSQAPQVVNVAVSHGLTVNPKVQRVADRYDDWVSFRAEASRAVTGRVPDLVIPGLNGPFPPKPAQLLGIRYLLDCDARALVADDTGAGKTLLSYSVAAVRDAYPLIVVCKAGYKLNWRDELRKWFPGRSSFVLEGRTAQRLPDVDVYIVNYDILPYRWEQLAELNPKGLVVDESHEAKEEGVLPPRNSDGSPKLDRRGRPLRGKGTQHSAALVALADSLPVDAVRLCLTATPMPNGRPMELWNQLRILGRDDEFVAFARERLTPKEIARARGQRIFPKAAYGIRWCNGRFERGLNKWEFGPRKAWKDRPAEPGVTNFAELRHELRVRCMLRRNKLDMNPELDALDQQNVLLGLTKHGADEYRRANEDFVAYIIERSRLRAELEGRNPDAAEREAARKAERAEDLMRLSVLRQVASQAKMDAAVAWIEARLAALELDEDRPAKLLVYAYYRETQDILIRRLSHLGCGFLLSVSDQPLAKQRQVRAEFQDPESPMKILVCSATAAREGHTLTAAHELVLVEPILVPGHVMQIAGRFWGRLNDLHGGTMWHLLGERTIDMWIHKLLSEKTQVIDALDHDGDLTDDSDLIEDLFAHLSENPEATETDISVTDGDETVT